MKPNERNGGPGPALRKPSRRKAALDPPATIASRAFDRAATRLLATILAESPTRAAFPIRVELALAVTLDLLEEHRLLAQILTADPHDDRALLARQRSWASTFAEWLREAAATDPTLRLPPPSVERRLIAAISQSIGTAIRSTPRRDLRGLLPSLLEFTLAYYVEPPELGALLATATWTSTLAARSAPLQ